MDRLAPAIARSTATEQLDVGVAEPGRRQQLAWLRRAAPALTSRSACRCVLAGCESWTASAVGLGGREELAEAAKGSEGIDAPEEPGHGVAGGASGRVSRKRRSRKRLAFSHEVSEANEQQWHAAPWRKSSGSLGVRIAHTGSDEHRAARRSAETTSPCSRIGSESATSPPRVPSLSDAVVQISSAGRGLPLRDVGPAVDAFGEAGRAVAARHRHLADQRVRRTCAAASSAARAGGCRGRRAWRSRRSGAGSCVGAPARWASHSGVARMRLLPRVDGVEVELEEDPFAAVLGGRHPGRLAVAGELDQPAGEVVDAVHLVEAGEPEDGVDLLHLVDRDDTRDARGAVRGRAASR